MVGATPRGPLSLPPGGAHWYVVREIGFPDKETFDASYELAGAWLTGFAEKTGVRTDFDVSFQRYRQQIVHALAMWTITLCHSPLLPNMQPEDTTLTMIERMTTAMADLDALDS